MTEEEFDKFQRRVTSGTQNSDVDHKKPLRNRRAFVIPAVARMLYP
jgi:hypothetical protein